MFFVHSAETVILSKIDLCLWGIYVKLITSNKTFEVEKLF